MKRTLEMLREIVLLILSPFFLKSALVLGEFNDTGHGQSPIDIDLNSCEEKRESLALQNHDKIPDYLYAEINKTGDQIGKIFTEWFILFVFLDIEIILGFRSLSVRDPCRCGHNIYV